MRRKVISAMLCILMIAMAFITVVQPIGAQEYKIKKVKVIPVPWQEWRIVWDPTGGVVIGVEDIIFFDPPEMPDDEVALVREYAVLYIGEGPIPLEDLTWDGTQSLLWEPVDDPAKPYILPLNSEVRLFIPTNENVSAVLVRYTVAWASTPTMIEAHFVNEAILESKSPQVIVGSLSNFDVHNDYPEPIDNFELELYGNIEPSDILYVYDPPGGPYRWNTSFGTVWYGGWGAPPLITVIPGGIKIEWIDPDHPVPYCEWIHFGVALNLEKKVKIIPAPVQFWNQFLGGVTDIIIFDPPGIIEPCAIVRDYVVLDYDIPLDELTWEATMTLPWIPIDDPANPYILDVNETVEYDIYTTENDSAVLVRYTVAWESTQDVIEAHFVNEAILESKSPQVIVGQLMNFDVHNDYNETVDNFELELYGILPGDIVGWYWQGLPPAPFKIGNTWYGGWGTPPHISFLWSVNGTEIIWKDQNHPINPCEWVHFGLHVKPGIIGTGVKAYWTQTLNLTGAKAYLTQLVLDVDVDIKPGSDPNTINLKSKGRWVSVTIELPEGYKCTDIDPSTVLWDGTMVPVLDPKYGWAKSEDSYCVDENGNGVLERLLKFDRSDLEDLYSPGEHDVTITGNLFSGMPFEGSDSIRLISPP